MDVFKTRESLHFSPRRVHVGFLALPIRNGSFFRPRGKYLCSLSSRDKNALSTKTFYLQRTSECLHNGEKETFYSKN